METSLATSVNRDFQNGIPVKTDGHLKAWEYTAFEGPHYHKLSPLAADYGSTRTNSYKKNKEKRNVGLSVLTLLSFLFFLHILQNCLQEQDDNLGPQVVIMQAKLKRGDLLSAKEGQIEKSAIELVKDTVYKSSNDHVSNK